MELKLANPHRAYVAMTKDRGSSVLFIGPNCRNATNSFVTRRVPSRLPMVEQSFHGTPIIQATGANTIPKICCSEPGSQPISGRVCTQPRIPFNIAISARKAISRSEEHTSELQSLRHL